MIETHKEKVVLQDNLKILILKKLSTLSMQQALLQREISFTVGRDHSSTCL